MRRSLFAGKAAHASLTVLSPLLILAVWDLVTRFGLVKPILLPPPMDVLRAFVDMMLHGYAGIGIFYHLGASIARVVVAFVAAGIVGIVLGLARGRYRLVDAALLIPAEVIRPIPPMGLIPLFILWFGIGEVSKVLLIFYYVFLIVMLNTESGVRSCRPDLIRAAQCLGATPLQIFRRVIFPSALPQIMTGLRVGMGSALAILVASELLGGDRGIGFVVLDAANFFRTNQVFVGIILIGLLGLAADRGLNFVARKFVHWEATR